MRYTRGVTVLLLVAHPDRSSLNHAIAERIGSALIDEGHRVLSHDLYAEHFEPVLENEEIRRRYSLDDTFARHAAELREADAIAFIYPDWWGMPPAILKGWIDRLFRPGLAYDHDGPEFGPKEKRALLTGRRALIITTTNETNPLSQEAMMALWRDRILAYVGIDAPTIRVLYDVRNASLHQRRAWLQEAEELARRWL